MIVLAGMIEVNLCIQERQDSLLVLAGTFEVNVCVHERQDSLVLAGTFEVNLCIQERHDSVGRSLAALYSRLCSHSLSTLVHLASG